MDRKTIIVSLVVILGLLGVAFLSSDPSTTENPADITSNPNLTLSDAHGLAVDIEDPQKVYVANHNGLYALENDKNLYQVGNLEDDLMGFTIDPIDPDTFYSSGHPKTGGNVGFQKTSDGGATWQAVSEGLNGPVDFHTLTIDQANPQVIYGYYKGQMQRSTDGGSSWSYVNEAPSDIIQLMGGTKEDSIYATTPNGLYVSSDLGDTWQAITALSGPVVSVANNPSDSNELLVYSQQKGLQKSVDGGETWLDVASPARSDLVLFIAYAKSNPSNIYFLTKSLRVYASSDGGETWETYL